MIRKVAHFCDSENMRAADDSGWLSRALVDSRKLAPWVKATLEIWLPMHGAATNWARI